MSAETELFALLSESPAVAALVATRISRNAIDGGAKPYIVYTRADTRIERGLDGSVFGELVVLEVQCWAATGQEAAAIADAVIAVIDGSDSFETTTGRTGGFDPEVQLDAEIVTVEWWA